MLIAWHSLAFCTRGRWEGPQEVQHQQRSVAPETVAIHPLENRVQGLGFRVFRVYEISVRQDLKPLFQHSASYNQHPKQINPKPSSPDYICRKP